MNKTTKYILWGLGGVAVLSALGFSIAALVGKKDDDDTYTKAELDELLRKQRETGLNPEEENRLNEIEKEITPPGPSETTNEPGNMSFPIGNNDKGKHIAQIQTAINQKHSNNKADYKGSTWSTWCCTGNDSKLAVDGQMGPKTMKAIKKYYGTCCECECTVYTACINRVCNCSKCNVTKSDYNRIVKGANVSDEKLKKEGYGFEYFSGFTNGIDKYEHDFGRVSPPNTYLPGIPAVGRMAGPAGANCCDNPSLCGENEVCNGCECMVTTRSEWRPGDVQWRKSGPKIPGRPDFGYRERLSASGCNPPCPKFETCENGRCVDMGAPNQQYSNFITDKSQLRGEGQLEWRDMEGVLGDFYPNRMSFVDDDIQQPSNLTHSYGMGKGFGFSGPTPPGAFSDWDASCSNEMCETQTIQEYIDDVP